MREEIFERIYWSNSQDFFFVKMSGENPEGNWEGFSVNHL